MSKPTAETYAELQQAYDMFNARLFDSELPECLITLQREKKAYGYFSAERFGNRAGEKTDEIALNPCYFAVVPLLEIMQTIVHEMAHLWQYHHGNPGRTRYHNTEWANKMEKIGLMPSSTGQPGGKRTGDAMADYPIGGGLFLSACRELLTSDFKISWYDRFASANAVKAGQNSFALSIDLDMPGGVTIASEDGIEMASATTLSAAENKSNRSKYTCRCDINVWGKPGLNLSCGDCGNSFVELP
ncbi:MAG TPA: SprT-like domain-containing protein [Methylobacter sp.]|jgi:predicted SprT family Zn-dependent metalloprotease